MHATSIDELIAARGRADRCDVTAERASYGLDGQIQYWLFEELLPAGFGEVYACRRRGQEFQIVWADEHELAIAVWHRQAATHYFTRGDALVTYTPRNAVEVWGSESGYHDRLDDLAGIVIREVAVA